MDDHALDRFLTAMPKAELHCHLMGTVRKQTFADLVREAGAPFSTQQVEAFYTRGEKPVNVSHVLRALDQRLVTRTEHLHRITFEYLEDSFAQGVRYCEFFWAPTGTVAAGIAYRPAQQAILAACADAESQFGIVGRPIPSIDRQASVSAATEMLQWVIDNRSEMIAGIGMEFEEEGRPPEIFAGVFAAATRAGLRKTTHAGENGVSWANVQTAIDLLGVDRIDHGYSVLDNPELTRRCADSGIVFTVVPTNSYFLRTLTPERWAQDHPIRHMPAAGLRIHPNTDDPTLHLVTATQAWGKMVRDFGFGIADLREFMLNGLDTAWIGDALRAQWRVEWMRDFDAARARWLPADQAA
jgi:adenosine deaminase